MIINAPAKVNLHLAVFDKRQDGFHNLESLFAAVDFGDTLHFELFNCEFGGKNEGKTELIMEGLQITDIPVEKNIIFKALSLFKKEFFAMEKGGFNAGLKIRVEKRIPAGGGLGGGSSNAASTLLALNHLAGSLYGEVPFNRFELFKMAAALGSDVPFFIHQIPAAWVTGRGEHIEPLEPPPWHFVLVNPGFPSGTAEAFKLLDIYRADKHEQDASFSSSFHQSNEPFPLLPSRFYNDFLPIFPEPQKSIYRRIISQLYDCGAEFANLSGAGSTCFGAFNDPEKAEKTALSLKNEWGFTQSCCVINSAGKN
jgi:4-diphosphocytidyl-2-C-methyl-D-erythritol kinase